MSKEDRIEYLEQERIKIWKRLTYVEDLVTKKTSDYEAEAKVSAEQASQFKITSEEAKNTIAQNLEESNSKLKDLRTSYTDFEELFNKIKEYSNSSKSDNDLIKSIYDDVESKYGRIEKQITEIEKIIEGKPQLDEKLLKLGEIFTKGDDYDSKINTLYKSITERKKEIDELYYQVIGYSERNEKEEEIKVKGLRDILQESYDSLTLKIGEAEKDLNSLKEQTTQNYEEFQKRKEGEFNTAKSSWENDYKKVLDKIERLLPNALTTGLSYAYSEKKDAEVNENNNHLKTFRSAILGLVIISLIPFLISIVSLFQNESLQTVIYRIPRIVLAILPLYLPVLWVAYSANKKMNLAKRLVEEYSHKEVLSKTFEGLSKQIENISDKDISADLRIRLLYNILEVNSENPGKLISDYNKTDHPLMDALDKSAKLSTAVEKLAKIPGFSRMANALAKKSEKLLKVEEEKVIEGLNIIEKENGVS